MFNPGAALVDGVTVLLARVEDRSGISHLTAARSSSGVDGWTIDPEPLLAPATAEETEVWGFEDARTVWIEEVDRFAITCTAYGPAGPAVFLATTTDFASVERHGIVKRAEDKNAALLPERVGGKWILFHQTVHGPPAVRSAAHEASSLGLRVQSFARERSTRDSCHNWITYPACSPMRRRHGCATVVARGARVGQSLSAGRSLDRRTGLVARAGSLTGDGAERGRRRSTMPLYMSTFEYKPEVWAELISHPENRTETVSRLLESAGCKLKGLWYAFGKSDGFALIEAPGNVTGASIMIAISASGAFSKFETTVLMTQDELIKALEQAQDVEYVAPGAAVHA